MAPWWEFSPVTNELLLQHGIKYDHSLMHDDFHPYYVRVGDSWTKIDYAAKSASAWMKPLRRGRVTPLIEIPASWYLDDLPPMMFIKASPNSHGFVNPRQLEQLWIDQFDWVYREYDYAVFGMTIHPDVSGKPQVLLMHERHHRAHQQARRRSLGDLRRDRERLQEAEPEAGRRRQEAARPARQGRESTSLSLAGVGAASHAARCGRRTRLGQAAGRMRSGPYTAPSIACSVQAGPRRTR